MIEVMRKRDIGKVTQPQVQAYLKTRFNEIGYSLNPSVEGYFIYIEDFTQLQQPNRLSYVLLPSIAEGLFRSIEAVTVQDKIIEVSILFNNEFLLSLIFYDMDDESLSQITTKRLSPIQTLPPVHNNIYSRSTRSANLSSLAISVGMILLRCALKR